MKVLSCFADWLGFEREWFSVTPKEDRITCNIGNMLMRWKRRNNVNRTKRSV